MIESITVPAPPLHSSALRAIERAVSDDRTIGLAAALAAIAQDDGFSAELFPPVRADHYTRRLLHTDARRGYSIIGMTWAPNQQTAIHDHAGCWGAEVVVRGAMLETTYELLSLDRSVTLHESTQRHLAQNRVSPIVPGYDHHRMTNDGDTIAHTLHVYVGKLATVNAYDVDEDGTFVLNSIRLAFDE